MKNALSYKMKKKYKNRLNWIERRFSFLDNEIDTEKLINDPINSNDYKLLQNKIENIQTLEEEYFKLIDEQEKNSFRNKLKSFSVYFLGKNFLNTLQ